MTTDGRVAVLQLKPCATRSEDIFTPARHEKAQYTCASSTSRCEIL